MNDSPSSNSRNAPGTPSLDGHLEILRVDHWIKNVFVLPGTVVALAFGGATWTTPTLIACAIALVAMCLVASSYYTLNEILDAPYDRLHPLKCTRPVPAGRVHLGFAYGQWLVLGAAGIALGAAVNRPVALVLAGLWLMGCLYNVRPFRTKDLPYIDVLSEALNNPLRMLLGWYAAGPLIVPPSSLLLSYWFVGAYFMAIKRFAEYREIGDRARAAAYRRSFAYYNEQRLLTSIVFHAAAAMLFLGAFTMRYRVELLLAYPLVALVMAIYLDIAFRENSAAQAPEKLHREPRLMAAVLACALAIGVLCFVDVPIARKVFGPAVRSLQGATTP